MRWTKEKVGNTTFEYNFGDGAYLLTPNVVKIKTNELSVVELESSILEDVIAYVSDINGNLTIDVSDIIRMTNARGYSSGSLTISAGNDIIDMSFVIAGDIPVDEMIIPTINSPYSRSPFFTQYLKIGSPSVWLESAYLGDLVQFYVDPSIEQDGIAEPALMYSIDDSAEVKDITFGDNSILIPTAAKMLYILDQEGGEAFPLSRQPLKCGRRYATVQWRGRSGVYKRHTFEVVEVKDNVTKVTQLYSVIGVDARKKIEQSFTLRLRDLNSYDYWYYSDIVTSDDVKVVISPIESSQSIVNISRQLTLNDWYQRIDSGVVTYRLDMKFDTPHLSAWLYEDNDFVVNQEIELSDEWMTREIDFILTQSMFNDMRDGRPFYIAITDGEWSISYGQGSNAIQLLLEGLTQDVVGKRIYISTKCRMLGDGTTDMSTIRVYMREEIDVELGEEYSVRVNTKSVTIQDSGVQDLNIDVTYKVYGKI